MAEYICKVSKLYARAAAGGCLCFRYKKPDGDWAEKSTGTRKRREAEKFRSDFQKKMESGQVPNDMAAWTVKAAEEWWIKQRKPPVIAENTWNSERYRLQHFVAFMGEKRKLRDVNNLLIDGYVRARMDASMDEWTIKKELWLWSQILDRANLFEPLKRRWPKLTPKASDIGQALTREQLKQLVKTAITNDDWTAVFYAFVLAANTGMRGGEIKKLKIGLIDLEHNELLIKRSLSKSDGRGFNIPLNDDAHDAAVALLKRYHKICRDAKIATSSEHHLMPFNWSRVQHGPNKGRRGYDPTKAQVSWDSGWATLTEEAGFPDFRFHDLRHTFVTHMVEQGIPLERIQTMVGQLSARMVRHYTHIASGLLHKDVSVLNSERLLPVLDDAVNPEVRVN